MDLYKGFNKILKNIPDASKDFAEDCLEVYENCADNLSNNLRLHEISILIFFQFYWKISRSQLEIVEEATDDLHSYQHFEF